jgi:hypothetical protein
MDLVLENYKLAALFPKKEKQGDAIPAAMAELGRMLAGLIKRLKSKQADT